MKVDKTKHWITQSQSKILAHVAEQSTVLSKSVLHLVSRVRCQHCWIELSELASGLLTKHFLFKELINVFILCLLVMLFTA